MLPILIYCINMQFINSLIHLLYTLTCWEIILFMIIPKHITYSPTCLSVVADDKHRYWQWQKYTVRGGCYSAHQAVSKFTEHNIDMVSWVHRKCQTRAGVERIEEDLYFLLHILFLCFEMLLVPFTEHTWLCNILLTLKFYLSARYLAV